MKMSYLMQSLAASLLSMRYSGTVRSAANANVHNPFDDLIGAKVYFFEEGADVDDGQSGTMEVGADAKPDQMASFDDYELGCAQSVKPENEANETERRCTSPAGNWVKTKKKSTEADYLDVAMAGFNEPVFRLLFGVANPLADAATQVPWSDNDRSIRGWVYLRGTKTDGSSTDWVQLWAWVDMSLENFEGFQPDFGENTLRFQNLGNALSTIEGFDLVA